MEARLPLGLVNMINRFIDRMRGSAHDHSPALFGQIKQHPRSAQLKLDLRQQEPAGLAAVIVEIAGQYVAQQGYRALVKANDMWSVHSYAGDYNPLHDHGG